MMGRYYIVEYAPYRGHSTITIYSECARRVIVEDDDVKGFCACLELFGFVNVSAQYKNIRLEEKENG